MSEQPKLGEIKACPNCGGGAIQRLADKYGPFIVCLSCSFNAERIKGPKRRTVRKRTGGNDAN